MIHYDLLKPGDVIGVCNTFGAFDMTEKVTVAGWQNIFASDISCHITLATDIGHGVFRGTAMDFPKIKQEDLSEYNHGKNGSHIVFVGRLPGLDFTKANEFLLESYARRIKYNVEELLKFWGYSELEKLLDPKHTSWICSDLPVEMWKAQGITDYPPAWNDKVAPYNEQLWNELCHIPEIWAA